MRCEDFGAFIEIAPGSRACCISELADAQGKGGKAAPRQGRRQPGRKDRRRGQAHRSRQASHGAGAGFDEQCSPRRAGPRLPALRSSPRPRSALAPWRSARRASLNAAKANKSKYLPSFSPAGRGFLRIHIPSSPKAFVSQSLRLSIVLSGAVFAVSGFVYESPRRRSSLICRVPAPMPRSARWSGSPKSASITAARRVKGARCSGACCRTVSSAHGGQRRDQDHVQQRRDGGR